MVLTTEDCMAFRDLNPQAPVHVLVIPKTHYADASELADKDPDLLGRLMASAARMAEGEGLASTGYRLVLNTGRDGGQTVGHIHVHVLGGRHMSWPPG